MSPSLRTRTREQTITARKDENELYVGEEEDDDGVYFEDFDISDPVLDALDDMGYETPTEIQELTIPPLLEGRDIIGQAQTGTGKTAAFGIPIIERVDPTKPFVQALVLAPTRELAAQICDEIQRIAKYRKLGVVPVYGGAAMSGQLQDLRRGAHVVVGTPGRVLDHLSRATLTLEHASWLILDEADRMLDMGFMPDVERIIRRMPRNRQTALFSATIPPLIKILSRRYMRNPQHLAVRPDERTVSEVQQLYFEVAERDKPLGLLEILATYKPEQAIIFRRTQAGVDWLQRVLTAEGHYVEAIHGSMAQRVRESVMAKFRSGEVRLLIATNVAARGLDIPEVTHVINYDVPEETESYIHRIGRTARMGRQGMAITFVSEWDQEALEAIKKVVGDALQPGRLALYQ